jgi:hypothetical protein
MKRFFGEPPREAAVKMRMRGFGYCCLFSLLMQHFDREPIRDSRTESRSDRHIEPLEQRLDSQSHLIDCALYLFRPLPVASDGCEGFCLTPPSQPCSIPARQHRPEHSRGGKVGICVIKVLIMRQIMKRPPSSATASYIPCEPSPPPHPPAGSPASWRTDRRRSSHDRYPPR